jgi:hypothetical protein
MKTAYQMAAESLRKNIICISGVKFLTAGQNQFQTLWTRDFCHAVKGLLFLGEREVVENHLSFLLSNLRADGLVPRVADNFQVQFRVTWQALRKNLAFLPRLPFRGPLKPQYIDEHGSNAFDSNLLLLRASLELSEEFWQTHESELKRVWHWYDDKFKNGLLWQRSFSDWQDTTRREGHTFLLNFFYYEVLERLEQKGFKVPVSSQDFGKRIRDHFFNGKVFLSQEGYSQVSVEGNLMAILHPHFLTPLEKDELWKNVKNHPVIKLDGHIGRCTYPDWPSKDLAFHIKLAKLSRYHGSLCWSWIMGLGLMVATKMNDDEMIQRQTKFIEKLLMRDGEVYEVYDPAKNFSPWGSWLMSSEHPFAWGAGYLVEAFSISQRR